MGFLTSQQIEDYQENGFLVIEKFWDDETVDSLRQRMQDILGSLDLKDPSAGSVFTTNDQHRKSDNYFLSSGRSISFFWEERAWLDGKLQRPPEECINKVGHGLHDLDSQFERVSYDARIGSMCRELGLEIPLAVQSMYIFKQAFVGGEVGAHQDGAFLYTEPQTCIGFWWALDDCHKENGCLWAVPGSHRLPVRRRFCRKAERTDGECGTEWQRSADAVGDMTFDPSKPEAWDLTQAIPLIIPRGSLVILHNAVVHYSEGNFSPKARHAYSIHVVDAREGVVYPADNWLQRPEEHPFRSIDATVA
jgi:phytanoyl-CoA hydroxylase